MKFKEKKFDIQKIRQEDNYTILVDNYKDEEYLDDLGLKVINIHKLYQSFIKDNNKTLIQNIDKYIFIAKELDRDVNNYTFKLGDFFAEYKLYDVQKKAAMINFEITPNFKKIDEIYNKYEKFKEDNNYIDMSDLLYNLQNSDLKGYETLYLFNFIYLDNTRLNIVDKIVKKSKNVFLLKYENQDYTNAEKKLFDIKRPKRNLKFKATYKKMETKTSIFSFLKKFQDQNNESKNGFLILNNDKYNFFIDEVNWNEVYFIYSILNIKYGNWDFKDIDNIFRFLNAKKELKEFEIFYKNNKMVRSIDFIKENFINNEDIDFIFNLIDLDKKEILIRLLDKFESFDFLKEFLPLVDFINEKNFVEDFKTLLYIHLKENIEMETLCGMEKIIWSNINTFDNIFIIYGGIKEQKESFISNNHRKDLGLLDSDEYQEIQVDLIKNIARFENVVFLDYKYEMNEENLVEFPLELEEYIPNLKPFIDKEKKILKTFPGKFNKEYDFIKEEYKMDHIPVEKIHLLLEPKEFIKSMNQYEDLYITDSNEKIDKELQKVLSNFFIDKDKLLIFKNKPVTESFKIIMEEMKYLENISMSSKSKFILLRGQLLEWLKNEKEFLRNNSLIVQKKHELLFPFFIEELNGTFNIYLNFSRIDKVIENSKESFIVNFFMKEPNNWQNKYQLKKVTNNILRKNRYPIKEIRFSFPY